MTAPFADGIAPGDVVRLVGAVETYARVESRTARALVVLWHGFLYRARGAASAADVWRCTDFEPWAIEGRPKGPRKARTA